MLRAQEKMEPSMLAKAFRLIEALAGAPRGRALAELAAATALAKPTAHRLLKTLCDMGYVERIDAGVYRLGFSFARIVLGREYERILAAASPALDRLHELTRETANLAVLQQGQVLYLAVRECTYPLRRVATPHESHPWHCTALGRAIVAFLPDSEQEDLIGSRDSRPRTPHTVMQTQQLRRLLAAVREQGYAIEDSETDLGVMCVGAPVFDAGRAVAAISVSVPTVRVAEPDRQALVELVRDAAANASAVLQRKGQVQS